MSSQVQTAGRAFSDADAPKPKFTGGLTVLMAVWSRDDPALFEAAVASVVNSTLVPDDFIVVVDGPVPSALDDVITRLEGQHRLVVLRLPANGGLAKALNHGLGHVRTAWVARADADDMNVADRFEKQALAIARASDRIDVLGGAILEVERSGEPVAVREVPIGAEAIAGRLRTRNPFNHMTVVFRTSCVVEAGGYPDIHLKEDYALWATLIARGARCQNLGDVVVRATAGRAMYLRRGGLRYVASEWNLQLLLYRLGHSGLPRAVVTALARSFVFLLPSVLRGFIYRALLRRAPAVQDAPPYLAR